MQRIKDMDGRQKLKFERQRQGAKSKMECCRRGHRGLRDSFLMTDTRLRRGGRSAFDTSAALSTSRVIMRESLQNVGFVKKSPKKQDNFVENCNLAR